MGPRESARHFLWVGKPLPVVVVYVLPNLLSGINEVNQAPLPQAFLFQRFREALNLAVALMIGKGCPGVLEFWV